MTEHISLRSWRQRKTALSAQAKWAAALRLQRAGRPDRLQRIESRLQRIEESGRRDFLKHSLGGAAVTVALGVFVNSMPVPALWTLFTPRRPIHHRVSLGRASFTFTIPELQVTHVPAKPPPIAREVYRV